MAVMSVSATKLLLPPSPLNTLLESVPVYSEALLNKPVDCVLLGVGGAKQAPDPSLSSGMTSPHKKETETWKSSRSILP